MKKLLVLFALLLCAMFASAQPTYIDLDQLALAGDFATSFNGEYSLFMVAENFSVNDNARQVASLQMEFAANTPDNQALNLRKSVKLPWVWLRLANVPGLNDVINGVTVHDSRLCVTKVEPNEDGSITYHATVIVKGVDVGVQPTMENVRVHGRFKIKYTMPATGNLVTSFTALDGNMNLVVESGR